MKLIITADDFGLSRSINYGIVDACRLGIVRSASLMTCGQAYAHAVVLAKQTPILGVGVQLMLTEGRPILQGHRTLTDAEGRFLPIDAVRAYPTRMDTAEIEAEFCAQVEFVLNSGILPSHISSHCNVHMIENFFPIACHVARKYSLAIRVPSRKLLYQSFRDLQSADVSLTRFYAGQLDEEILIRMLDGHRETQVLEVVCHPGYADRALISCAYNMQRINETAILTGTRIRQYIVRNQIELYNYARMTQAGVIHR